MRSTKKEVVNKIRQHIKDCVYSCEGEEFETAKEAAAVLKKEFERVTNNQVSISHGQTLKRDFNIIWKESPFILNMQRTNKRKKSASGWGMMGRNTRRLRSETCITRLYIEK